MKLVQLHATASDRFDEFWTAYPRRIGKPLAKAKWEKITNGGLKTRTLDKDSGSFVSISLQATAEELIQAAKRYHNKNLDMKTFKLKDDGKFICHPATWLNQGRWKDED